MEIGLIVSDLNIPGMNGIDVLKIVRNSANNSNAPFVMVTSEANQESVLEAVKARVTDIPSNRTISLNEIG